jgi:hypothetical protein
VYEVVDGERGIRVALKALSGMAPDGLLRLRDDFRGLRDLRHPNLVALHELTEDEGQWFFTMELVEGVDLLSWVRPAASRGAVDPSRLRAAFGQVALALAFLHRSGTAHGGVKASNAIVTAEGRVVVLDYGIAPPASRGAPAGAAEDWHAFGLLLDQAMAAGASPAPSPDLHALRDRLLASDPAARPAGAEVLAALGVAGEGDLSGAFAAHAAHLHGFVGRSAERSEIARAFGAAREQIAGVVVIGVSGIGKSALVTRAAGELRDRTSAVVLRGRCHEGESLPFSAFEGVVEGLMSHVHGSPGTVRQRVAVAGLNALAHVFPVLEALPELENVPPARGRDVRGRAFAAMKAWLKSLGTHAPVILVIDDVQWADADSVALLEDLGRAPSPPMLVLLTARPGDGASEWPAVAALGSERRSLRLRGLSSDEVGALIEAIEAEGGASSGLQVNALVRATGGHPMFVEELVRYARYAGMDPSARRAVLDDALRQRVERLELDVRDVLSVIAVAGVPTAVAAIAMASRLEPVPFARALTSLANDRLARVTGTQASAVVEPYHDRVRESVYAQLTEETRRHLHARLAEGLQRTGAAPEALVGHYQRAGQLSLAAECARKAAERMEATLAHARAASFYALAIELGAPSGAARTGLLLRLGESLGRAGRPMESAEAFLEAAATEGASEDERFELERGATEQLLAGGFLDEGRELARRLLGAVGVTLPTGTLRVLGSLAWHQWWARRAPADAPPSPDAGSPAAARRLDVRWTVGACLTLVDPPVGALLLSSGLREALRHGDGLRRARALCAASLSESAQGDVSHAARFMEAAARAADVDGSDLARFYALLARAGYLFLARRDTQGCLEPLASAESLWRAAGRGGAWETVVLEQYSSWALWWTGDLAAFRARWEAGRREAHLHGHRYRETYLRVAFPYPHLIDDRPALARAEVAEAAAQWSAGRTELTMVDFWSLEARSWTWLYEGLPDGVEEIDREWDRFERSLLGRVRVLASTRELLGSRIAVARGLHARRSGDRTEADRQFARAARFVRLLSRRDDAAGATRPLFAAIVAFDRGEVAHGVAALRLGIEAWVRQGSVAVAVADRHRLGEWLDGDEGAALCADADAWLRARGVKNTAAFVRMLTGVPAPP